ncbi:GET complex subunit get1 [Malassezia cuniculi]|uniref:GET complex subunit get1 n=1 Tax=Malassezia cuniculi TaxID=948313 RepID=A0AAF0J656_9BASI|nr:GET complex subunit get1 [Malassezia cuniculi]
MHPAVLIFLVSLVNQAIAWIGRDLIQKYLFALYTAVCQRSTYKQQSKLKKELFETRQKLNTTSAQDEFAKWARLRRSIDKLTADLDQTNKGLAGSQFTFSIFFRAVMFVINSIVPFVMTSYYGSTPMFFLPPGDWFGPLGYLFSFPKAPAGAVSSTVWSTVCVRVLNIVGAYCYEFFVSEKAEALAEKNAQPPKTTARAGQATM